MKIKVTQRQRDNALLMLHKYWPSVPEANVVPQLATWRYDSARRKPTCKTVACFGGWCAVVPEFQAQGARPVRGVGAPNVSSFDLFGEPGLFSSRGRFESDADFTGTDHELVTRRLQWLIAHSEVVA